MFKPLLSTLLIAASFLFVRPVSAQVEWFSPQNGAATDNMIEVRWGDSSGSGDWELGMRSSGSGFSPISSGNHSWQNGQSVPFSFYFNPSGGTVSFTLGGTTTSHTYSDYSGKGLDDIHLVAKTSNNSTNDSWICQISNLVANGSPVGGNLTAQTVNGNGSQWVTGTLSNLTGDYGQLVSVQGIITFAWSGNEPQGSNMEILCYLGPPYDPSTGNQITVVSPNGGETWISGTQQRISWANTNIKKLRIKFSSDGGASWTIIKNNIKGTAGHYDWSVPNIQSTNCLIRIENKDNSNVYDISNAPFTVSVPPALDLTAPNGGEVWTAGTQQSITWTSRGLTTIALEYTADGTSWNMINAAAPAPQGVYAWTVPATASKSYRVRASGGGITDMSAAAFTVLPIPTLTLTSPNGGEVWTAGSIQTISWTYANVSSLTLQYSTDAGANWKTIEANIGASNGAYSWTVPNAPSQTCLIRAYANENNAVIDYSNGAFTIAPVPSVSLTSPNGGEQWTAGTAQTISWSSVNVQSVTLSYTTDGGTWNTIAESVPAANGSYSWTVPAAPSSTCLVRVTSAGNAGVSDDSNAAFAILPVPAITLTSPNGGETWMAGTQQTIGWTQTNAGSLTIEFTSDGTNWSAIAQNIVANVGSYQWTTPAISSMNCRIRISSTTFPGLQDQSDAAFSVIPAPSITLVSPNGGENWIAGSSQSIVWTSTTVAAAVLEYTTDGINWLPVANNVPAASGSYSWTVPATPSTTCRVRATGSVSGVTDASDGSFTIMLPASITVTSPNGGESWLAGSSQAIAWTSTSVASVTIAYSTDGFSWSNIAENVNAAAGSYLWTVPETASSFCFIRVTKSDDAAVSDVSNDAFAIVLPKSVAITTPNGGETLVTGTSVSIGWTSRSVTAVNLSYTADGASWNSIAENVNAAAGSYAWTLPSIETTQCRFMVTDASDQSVSDTSDGPITIKFPASVTVSAPNGGENWFVGTTHTISWTSVNVSAISIEYTTDGSSWTLIASDIPAANGSYTWTVPAQPSQFCAVRVTGTGGAADVSDGVFAILPAPAITVTSPNGGENWTAGSVHNITWTGTSLTTLTLSYSTNGTNWISIASAVPAANGSYTWTLPEIESATVTVRILDETHGIADTSDAPFTLTFAPTITINSPNGGENWTAGTKRTLAWRSTNVATVNITYTTDGANWTTIAQDVNGPAGSYEWTLPAIESTSCLIRITSAADAGVTDTSDAPFTITAQPTIMVMSPNGGENWTVGSSQTIQWSSSNVATVNIDYSTDGANWTTVAQGVNAASGSYSWTVPATPSTVAVVRVSHAANPGITDSSNAAFSIVPAPAITLTAPNGGEIWTIGSPQIIAWTSVNVGTLIIEFSPDGASWSVIADNVSAAAGSYQWTVVGQASATCRVRLTSSGNSAVNDMSDGNFSIVNQPAVTLLTPNGGESWTTGTTQNILWTSTNIPLVTIDYTTDGASWTPIVSGINAATGSYSWTVPATPSQNCLVRISDGTNGGPSDRSDAVFSIAPAPVITVVAPNGGESWTAGTTQAITWTSANVNHVRIEFTSDNGANWTTLAENIPAATQSWSWTVPATPSAACAIRLSAMGAVGVSDQSNAAFTVLPEPPQPIITVVSPNGGETLTGASQHTIVWTSANVQTVGIEYTIDGNSWVAVASGIAASAGSYAWTVPNTPSGYCFVRVFSVANTTVRDVSNAQFTILSAPTITVIAPNGGEQWLAGTTQTITWWSTNVTAVNISYAVENGQWNTIATNINAATASYVWTVANNPSTQAIIKIESANNTAITDQSNAAFTILPIPDAKIVNINTGVGYTQLYNAVTEVQPGQTLEFRKSGTYDSENINLSKANTTLRTAAGLDVRLRSNWKDQCLIVSANGVTLSGFRVYDAQKYGIKVTGQNATLTNITSTSYIGKYSVYAEGADYLTVTNLTTSDVGEGALCLTNSDHATVNTILTPSYNAVKNAVVITGSSDISLMNLNVGTDWQDDVVITGSSDIRIGNSEFHRARHAVYAYDSSGVVITNCNVLATWESAVYFDTCTNCSLVGGTIRTGDTAVYVKSSNGVTVRGALMTADILLTKGVHALNSSGVVISGCTIEKGWDDAIYLNNCPAASIDHNIVRNMKMGVDIDENSHGTIIINNTFADTHSSGIYVKSGLTFITIKNNIIVYCGWDYWTWGIQCQSDNHPGLSISYNNIWSNREDYKNCYAGVGDISANPLFVSNYGNVHLQPGSPSIDAGDPSDPIGSEPQYNGDRIDQGAYGGTSEATPTTARVLSIADAAANGWISMYCYPWDGMEYRIVSSLTNEEIQPWSGFWVIVNRNLDILFPPDQSQGSAPTEMSTIVDPERFYLISSPLRPVNPDINAVFGDDLGDGNHDGAEWQFWRTSKYNYLTETYDRYTGAGSIPVVMPGRGFWMYHIYPIPMYLTVTGTAVPQNTFTEFKLPIDGNPGTFHMVGNPFHYPLKWKDVKVRVPMTESNPLGKIASAALPEDESELDLWHISLAVADPTGTFYDNDNRAGVVESGDNVSAVLSSLDLAPFTGDYVRLVLKDPVTMDAAKYSYNYYGPLKNEYRWDIELTTSFGHIDANFDINGVEEIPEHYTVSLLGPDGKETPITEDTTLQLGLTNFAPSKYTLIARRTDVISVETDTPKPFAINGTYPNPFNPSTTIEFSMEKEGRVKARVYNMTGQLVATLMDDVMPAGRHTRVWDASGQASGVYILVMEANGKRDTAKVMLLK